MPLLLTPRLMLREMNAEDAPSLYAIFGDPETMLWHPRPYTEAEVKERIVLQQQRYPTGAGLLSMVLRETGEVIGDCGLVWQDVEGVLEPEIGYHVLRAHWGRGFAAEGARAARDYAFSTLGCDHVVSLIRPENAASRRVAEKNGLTLDRMVLWRDREHCLYLLRKEASR